LNGSLSTSGGRGGAETGYKLGRVVVTALTGETAEAVALEALPQVPGGIGADGSTLDGSTAVSAAGAAGWVLIVGRGVAGQAGWAERSTGAGSETAGAV